MTEQLCLHTTSIGEIVNHHSIDAQRCVLKSGEREKRRREGKGKRGKEERREKESVQLSNFAHMTTFVSEIINYQSIGAERERREEREREERKKGRE